ncbi:MAG TPA: molybdopterin dinucleotide binding domain-containing protein [Acidobacteriota bacterium]|nr:molybdopterin dinucleotide binding domain-containing protein [Acidobacteriota bacterium]
MSFVFISGRSTNQGRYINIGKDTDEYRAMVNVLSMNDQDIARLGLSPGTQVRVRSEWGESIFKCAEGELPEGIVFALYGPPTSPLIGGQTDGTGMPAQKGFEVEIEAVDQPGAIKTTGE